MNKRLYTFHLNEKDLKNVINALDFYYFKNFKTEKCYPYKALADTLQNEFDRIQKTSGFMEKVGVSITPDF